MVTMVLPVRLARTANTANTAKMARTVLQVMRGQQEPMVRKAPSATPVRRARPASPVWWRQVRH